MADDRVSPDDIGVSAKRPRGFAAMTEERRREIAASGGRGLQSSGKAHKFSQEEAREAGRKGGLKLSLDREHMAKIGRLGAKASRQAAKDEGSRDREQKDSSAVFRVFVRACIHIHLPVPLPTTTHVDTRDGWPADPIEFGKAVRKARSDLEITQAALAEIAGISEPTVRNVEKAHRVTTRNVRAWIIQGLTKLKNSSPVG